MATCNDCIYRPKCISFIVHVMGDDEINGGLLTDMDKRCKDFKNKTDVIVSPCKVGDIVYSKYSGTNEIEYYIIDKVIHLGSDNFEFEAHLENEDGDTVDTIEFGVKEIGLTVFFAEEEAVQKLRKENEWKNKRS